MSSSGIPSLQELNERIAAMEKLKQLQAETGMLGLSTPTGLASVLPTPRVVAAHNAPSVTADEHYRGTVNTMRRRQTATAASAAPTPPDSSFTVAAPTPPDSSSSTESAHSLYNLVPRVQPPLKFYSGPSLQPYGSQLQPVTSKKRGNARGATADTKGKKPKVSETDGGVGTTKTGTIKSYTHPGGLTLLPPGVTFVNYSFLSELNIKGFNRSITFSSDMNPFEILHKVHESFSHLSLGTVGFDWVGNQIHPPKSWIILDGSHFGFDDPSYVSYTGMRLKICGQLAGKQGKLFIRAKTVIGPIDRVLRLRME
ncbi:hypothetical protein HKX48_000107 [Thoreauomyces humboldtii]|nr:hypothetical protein HKX48_000107 [Thoreauomyces humboldtii]